MGVAGACRLAWGVAVSATLDELARTLAQAGRSVRDTLLATMRTTADGSVVRRAGGDDIYGLDDRADQRATTAQIGMTGRRTQIQRTRAPTNWSASSPPSKASYIAEGPEFLTFDEMLITQDVSGR
jgi:hypothetical protein